MATRMTLKAFLFATAVVGLTLPGFADDHAGTLTPEMAAKVHAAKPNYSPYVGRNSPPGRFSGIPIFTRRLPSMPVPSAHG